MVSTSRSFLPLLVAGLLACSGSSGSNDDLDGGAGDDASSDSSAKVDGGGGDTHADAGSDGGGDGGKDATDATTDAGGCGSVVLPDGHGADRTACKFAKGATVEATLGITPAMRKSIPITHVVVVMQENRSFDHYFGTLSKHGQPDAEGWPAGYALPDDAGKMVPTFHRTQTCQATDTPHAWTPAHADWNGGKMDGFVKQADDGTSDGHYVMGSYEATELPFYYFLANTYAISDRYFASVIGPTWPNRLYLYAATSDGVMNTGGTPMSSTVPTLFDALDKAKVKWGVYTDGGPRQGCIEGWTKDTPGVANFSTFLSQLADGTLPPVSFVDPSGATQDEHPPNDIQKGEAWSRRIYQAAIKSPLWNKLVVFHTYDEFGGFPDHVPPPKACLAAADQTAFDRLGFRVPLIAVSPWAKPHHVSHVTHSHTSITRFIELLHDLPALTGRDANSDALLDLFDFGCAALTSPKDAPVAGTGGCP
jgi:phospholipase C